MISFSEYFTLFLEKLSEVSPKELGLKSSMVYLPDSTPYGFWMDNHGNFIPVNGVGDHERIAGKILERMGEKDRGYGVYDFLMKRGWVRIVCARGMKKFYYETYPGTHPNNIQKKNMQFISEFYELSKPEIG